MTTNRYDDDHQSGDDPRWDDLFLTAAKLADGNIETLLTQFFSFLRRRSDFYTLLNNTTNKDKGFLPGQAEELVLKAFHKQWQLKLKPPPAVSLPAVAAPQELSQRQLPQLPPQLPLLSQPPLRPPLLSQRLPLLSFNDSMSIMTIEVPVNDRICKSDVIVRFGQSYVTIKVSKLDDFDFTKTTYRPIRKAESCWYINHSGNINNPTIVLSLVKVIEEPWRSPFDELDPPSSLLTRGGGEEVEFYNLPLETQQAIVSSINSSTTD